MTEVETTLSHIRSAMDGQAAQLQEAINGLTLSPEQYTQLHELIEGATMPPEQMEQLAAILDNQVQHMRFAMSALAVPAEQLERLRNLVRGRAE